MKQNREQWVDYAKGIGIILVVMGHAGCPEYPHALIYTFHMPLFFFLSGLFIEHQCQVGFVEYVKKNARSLLIPYFYFNVFSIMFYFALSKTTGKCLLDGSVMDNVIGIFLCVRWGTQYHHVLWFLPCLFFAKMMAYPLYANHNTRAFGGGKYIIAVIMLLIGLFYSVIGKIPLPMSVDASMIACAFIVWGDCYMKHKSTILAFSSRYWLAMLIIAIGMAIYNFNGVEMYEMRYGNWLCFVIASVSSILLVCLLCQKCQFHSKIANVITRFGTLSLFVFCNHYYCLFIPITLKNRIVTSSNVVYDYIYWLGAIAFALMFVLPISSFLNNKAKWIIGK